MKLCELCLKLKKVLRLDNDINVCEKCFKYLKENGG